jgi:hypothetical protein
MNFNQFIDTGRDYNNVEEFIDIPTPIENVAVDVANDVVKKVGNINSDDVINTFGKVGDTLTKVGNKLTNEYLGIDIDIFAILFIVLIMIMQLEHNYGIPIGACVFGGYYYTIQKYKCTIKKYKKD